MWQSQLCVISCVRPWMYLILSIAKKKKIGWGGSFDVSPRSLSSFHPTSFALCNFKWKIAFLMGDSECSRGNASALSPSPCSWEHGSHSLTFSPLSLGPWFTLSHILSALSGSMAHTLSHSLLSLLPLCSQTRGHRGSSELHWQLGPWTCRYVEKPKVICRRFSFRAQHVAWSPLQRVTV